MQFKLLFRYFNTFYWKIRTQKGRSMSTFVSVINPVTGRNDWTLQDENYDYHQEIARSAYADMLHDTERNKKYYAALEKAVKKIRTKGEKVHVLDIGTGTGLLSMMAATLGADTITACEAFQPMAECAQKVIAQNGFADKINLIPKRSTEVKVGENGDMKERANILITEVFDTELIGEGAIGTFTHAHNHLLQKNCIVVPSAANMYIQLVSSDFIRRWRDIQPIKIKNHAEVIPPEELTRCGGAPSLHDLQLDQITTDQFQPLSQHFQVFRFDFSGKTKLVYKKRTENVIKCRSTGATDAVFMWWDLEMDEDREIILSCAPSWAHPNIDDLQWRDHWMQAIYYPSNRLHISEGEEVKVISCHDEYSLWFEVTADVSDAGRHFEERGPVCECGLHIWYNRTHLGAVNDPFRRHVYETALQKNVTDDTVCLCLGDGNIQALMVAKLGARKVFSIEEHANLRIIMESFVKRNSLEEQVAVFDKADKQFSKEDLDGYKINLIVAEPYFQSSVLPWHNIHFWYAVNELTDYLDPKAVIIPSCMTIRAMAIELKDLWKIRAPVGNCEGFSLQIFDDLIETSSDVADAEVEPQPMWEYPCIALSDIQDVYTLDYKHFRQAAVNTDVRLVIERQGTCNGVVLWVDFQFGNDAVISTGPREKPKDGENVKWDYYTRQGVHLMKHPLVVPNGTESAADIRHNPSINIKFQFLPETGEFNFKFQQK